MSFFIILFWRYSWFNNPAIWLVKDILTYIPETKISKDFSKHTAINIKTIIDQIEKKL